MNPLLAIGEAGASEPGDLHAQDLRAVLSAVRSGWKVFLNLLRVLGAGGRRVPVSKQVAPRRAWPLSQALTGDHELGPAL